MEPIEQALPSDTPKEPGFSMPEQRELSSGEKFTQDLSRVNAEIVAMLTAGTASLSDLREAWTVRAVLTEQFIDSLEDGARVRVQFDILVDKALIFEKNGNLARFLEELDSAEAFAHMQHMDQEAQSVGDEIDAKISELGNTPEELVTKLRDYIEFSNRDYLRELLADGMDHDDFLGNVYGMILDEGGDPDEVFKKIGITE